MMKRRFRSVVYSIWDFYSKARAFVSSGVGRKVHRLVCVAAAKFSGAPSLILDRRGERAELHLPSLALI